MAAALDGGAFLSAFLQVMFDRIVALGAVLDDAENKETRNQAVKEWLEELHETVYEAAVYEDDDLLDQINTEAPRVKVETEYQSLSSTGQVSSTVFTAYDSDKFLEGIMPKIKNIVVRLDKFIKQIGQLGLRNGESKIKSYQTLSTSLVDETTLYGRDVDKYEIIQILLSEDAKLQRGLTDKKFLFVLNDAWNRQYSDCTMVLLEGTLQVIVGRSQSLEVLKLKEGKKLD
ncbi:hypothetical protein ACH5RR_028773 [Cinchona calisaya]|uniref:Disease resistance N-terminal domain-containing protein n=1 Tax=Cinchona calisaya TaxID=153742 RepID=A0ABD2YU81_9GENT